MGLTIALNRGRILDEGLPLLAAAGIAPLEDPGRSRKLVFDTEGGHRVVVMRGADVPTYVEYGAADIGIVGKDTLLEYGNTTAFYECLDLNIARCRIMTAAPRGARLDNRYDGNPLRVATKFVRVARAHFERAARQVVIIPLSGAMEIAPLMNLADCIVDIVDTGNTLKANGLEALDTIADISTRVIVNRAAMKTRFDAVQDVLTRLQAASGGPDAAAPERALP